VVPTPRDGALGPFRSQHDAREAVDAGLDAVPLRPCTLRIPARDAHAGPCALYELRRCAAPCAGHQDVDGYAPAVSAWRQLVDGADDGPLHALADEVTTLAVQERFEAAARGRDRLAGLVGALGRAQRLTALAGLAEVVGARPDGSGGWELAVVRHGRLAAAGVARRGVPPMPVVEALRAGATTVLPGPGPLRGAAADEVRLLHRWLTVGGTRLVACDRPWEEPAHGAGGWAEWARRARPVEVPAE
jgi:DNA polymerase-3 subunit epsilon